MHEIFLQRYHMKWSTWGPTEEKTQLIRRITFL